MNRRVNHGLKEFIIQSDNGEFKSDAVLEFLKSVGGNRRTCCAYTPEVMAYIERLWGIIDTMATAMMIDKKLPEPFWELAQKYALDIYNNIPPTRSPKGTVPMSPNEKFFGVKEDTSLYKVFGCRAFAHIPKQYRRKNHEAKSTQCIFVGLDRSSHPGYMLYSPELRTIFVSGDVVFHQNLSYDGSLTKNNTDIVPDTTNVPEGTVDDFMYLVGTNHIDPDNGLLYKVMSVEQKTYRNQGTFIVAMRAQVFPDGRVSTKCDRDAIHVRDVQKYHDEYTRMIASKFTHVNVPQVANPESNTRRRSDRLKLTSDAADGGVTSVLGKRTRGSVSHAVFNADISVTTHSECPLFYGSLMTMEPYAFLSDMSIPVRAKKLRSVLEQKTGVADGPSPSDTDLALLVESAMIGDSIVEHSLTHGMTVSPDDKEPQTIKQAYSLPDKDKWREAVDAELDMIRKFNVFSEPVPLPAGVKPLSQRWVFKRKRDHHGNVIKHKARLTPQGCYQHFGSEYSDTYAPVARMCTLRYVMSLACLLQLQTSSCDFTNAFLNAELHEDVYLNAPPGSPPLPEGMVYKLQRALYGLKQSPREWNRLLNDFMINECGFTPLKTEKCLYIKRSSDGGYVLVCLYVDDLVVAYSHRGLYDSFISKVKSRFKITQTDDLHKTLGFQIERTKDLGVFMHQSAYIHDVLKRFGMENCTPVETPFDPHIRLCKSGKYSKRQGMASAASQGENSLPSDNVKSKVPYRELIGCLLWISMGTRPDITYATNQCARYSSDPKPEHWTACLRILRYLKGTIDY